METSLVIFEDNNDLRKSIQVLLQGFNGFKVNGAFADCNDITAVIKTCNPDVVLMDIDMPGRNGVEGVRMIKAMKPDTLVLMLTVFEDNEHIFESLCAGADGYLLKSTPPHLLLNALEELTKGGAPMTPKIAKQVLGMLPRKDKNAGNNFSLSPREQEVLALLVKGYSYKMIAAELFISFDTVRGHIRKIYEKLHVHSNTEAISKAMQHRIV